MALNFIDKVSQFVPKIFTLTEVSFFVFDWTGTPWYIVL